MANKYQKKGENPIRELARILASSEFHSPTFSSRMETVSKGECVAFPGVIIEQTLAGCMDEYSVGTRFSADKEWRRINELVKEAKLPVFSNHLKCGGRICIMSSGNTAINELIGQIKAEIITLDTRAYFKRLAKKRKS